MRPRRVHQYSFSPPTPPFPPPLPPLPATSLLAFPALTEPTRPGWSSAIKAPSAFINLPICKLPLVTQSTAFQTYNTTTPFFWGYQNDWNRGAVVGTYTESLTYDPCTFPNNTFIQWSYPKTAETTTVFAYPEVVWGSQDGGNYLVPPVTGPTAKQINNINSFTGTFNYQISGVTEGHDVLWEGWLTSGANNGALTHEIQYMLHTPSWLRTFVSSYATHSYNQGGFSGVVGVDTNATPPIITFLPTPSDMFYGTVDILAGLKYLRDTLGAISGTEFLGGWEMGAEIYYDASSLTINSLSYVYT